MYSPPRCAAITFTGNGAIFLKELASAVELSCSTASFKDDTYGMKRASKTRHILAELRGHLPFTLFGAAMGIFFMVIFHHAGRVTSHTLFAVFHPAHVMLSAVVTASMFRLHAMKRRFLLVFVVGYLGSIGIATLSDIVIPHIGSVALGLKIPAHSEFHHDHTEAEEHAEERGGIHFGFIEDWYIVTPAALLGIAIAWFGPRTKFPHAGHVLISTWASSSYLLMNSSGPLGAAAFAGVFATLCISTWLPCCISDIVFPLLLVGSDIEISGACHDHRRHSHRHLQAERNSP
jgi:hypothetical protein